MVVAQADQLDGAVHCDVTVGSAEAMCHQTHGHVLLHGQPRIQGEGLKHDRSLFIDPMQSLAVVQHAPRCGLNESGQTAQYGRFAGT